MVEYTLNSVFGSLSDPTRRDILQRLAQGELSVSAIAKAYNMSLAAISKHLKVLEGAKLIIKERRGRQQFIQLAPAAFRNATEHLNYYETLLNNRLDSLETYLRKEVHMVEPQTASGQAQKSTEQKLIMTHIFNAPRERVWAAYTDPKQIAQWWGPKGSELISCESQVRVGGTWRFVLRGADGQDYTFSGIFRQVQAPELLVYTDGFGEPDDPRPESLVTVMFDELPGGKTRIIKSSVATPAVHQLQAAWLKSAERKR